MKGFAYEGGIPYEVDLPTPSAEFIKFLDSIPCSCRGEVHDECRVCTDCGETPALNVEVDGEDYFCDECWEALVIEEERQFQLDRAEAEEFDNAYASMRDDHEAMKADQMRQREKEES